MPHFTFGKHTNVTTLIMCKIVAATTIILLQ